MNEKVLVAMSGGVDSSTAASLLKDSGYDVIGVTMKLYENEDIGLTDRTCCSKNDILDARRICAGLDVPYYVMNMQDEFREKVIDTFICSYEHGITPNPCIDCNRYMKFDSLYQKAQELGCGYIATGHYAQIEEEDGRYLLKKAVDLSKDQTYVLYMLTQDQLAHTLFPLGGMKKTDARKLAGSRGFVNADKKDSQDICFVPDGDYISVIKSITGKEYPEGDFTDADGNVLGTHSGIINYTLGQRKGLGIALGKPAYVTGIDADNNRVILGDNSDLFKREFKVKDINYISFDTPPEEFRASVRIRYSHTEKPATVYAADDTATVVFDDPQRAITPGQAAVFYDGDYVIGGGTIDQ